MTIRSDMEVALMFKQYYGMSMNPFDKGIRTSDAFLTEDTKAMAGRLDYIRNHPGIALFTAGPGQGKTFALRRFADSLNPNLTRLSYICLSTVTNAEFYRQLCLSLGLEPSHKKTAMFKTLQDFFTGMNTEKRIHCIICLDEAQYLGDSILRDLKILMNFEMDSKNHFSLVLLGQPTLCTTLMHQPHEALRQRIAVNYRFVGITEQEAAAYVKDRMRLVNASDGIFDNSALVTAYGACEGSIRKLNLILTKALTIGAQNQKQNIDSDIILAAVNDIAL